MSITWEPFSLAAWGGGGVGAQMHALTDISDHPSGRVPFLTRESNKGWWASNRLKSRVQQEMRGSGIKALIGVPLTSLSTFSSPEKGKVDLREGAGL